MTTMMPESVSITPWMASDIIAIELEMRPIVILNIARHKLIDMAMKPALYTFFLCVRFSTIRYIF